MSAALKREQQFVTAIVPFVYVVWGIYLVMLSGRLALLFIPVALIAGNPVLWLRLGLLPKWKRRYAHIFSFGLWAASSGLVALGGVSGASLPSAAFFLPAGYAALFFARRSFASMLLLAVLGMITPHVLGKEVFSVPGISVEAVFFVTGVAVCRVLHRWSNRAHPLRPLSLSERDRNNPRNQFRLNRFFGGVFLLFHVLQGAAQSIDTPLVLFGAVALAGFVLWTAISYALFGQPRRALQPAVALALTASCTASIAASGFAQSALFPVLYVLPVIYISFNTSRRMGTGTALLSFVLSALVIGATPQAESASLSRFVVYGPLFFLLPQVIGYMIREQMRRLKQRLPDEAAEWTG